MSGKGKTTCIDITPLSRNIGGGNAVRGMEAIGALALAMRHAREKHPDFARDDADAWDVISDEMEELRAEIVGDGTPERRREEAMDVAVTALRFWLGEHLPGGWK